MFLDIGLGFLLALWGSFSLNLELTKELVLWCVTFALLPDLDFFVEFMRHGSVGGKVVREHRELTHFPILYFVGAGLIAILTSPSWAILFFLGTFLHLLHDSVGIGYGVKWLWPFSKSSHKFFADKTGKLSRQFHISWSEEELKQVVALHGDPNWLKNIYLRPSLINLVEFGVFFLALIALYSYLN